MAPKIPVFPKIPGEAVVEKAREDGKMRIWGGGITCRRYVTIFSVAFMSLKCPISHLKLLESGMAKAEKKNDTMIAAILITYFLPPGRVPLG